MEKETSLAGQPIDTALEKLVLAKRQNVDEECERFVRIGYAAIAQPFYWFCPLLQV